MNLGKVPPLSGSHLPPLQKGSSGPDPQLSSDSRPCRDPSPGGTAVRLVWEEVWALVFFKVPRGISVGSQAPEPVSWIIAISFLDMSKDWKFTQFHKRCLV